MKSLNLPPLWVHSHYDTVDSTMRRCGLSDAPEMGILLVTADEQTAGRGQRGNHWECTRASGLTLNTAWRSPQIDDYHSDTTVWPEAREGFLIAEMIALAAARTIQEQLPPSLANQVAVKWPNDIYVGDCKIGGMLIEHALAGRRIEASTVGLGLNINQRVFTSDAPNPISLANLTGHDHDREAILERYAALLASGLEQLARGQWDEIVRDYAALLYRRTGSHLYQDAHGMFFANLEGVARSGMLTLRREDGTLATYAFKEVKHIIGSHCI